MVHNDWLVGGDRRSHAAERIYAAAADLIAREGMDAFDIDTLAARVHCSRATVYRCTGGKNAIRDVVMARSGERIVDAVRDAVAGLSGSHRVITAITVALTEIRTDPVGRLMISSLREPAQRNWLTQSPTVAQFAADINGLADDDIEAGQWILRVLLSLLYWPVGDPERERTMLERFISPAFTAP